MQPPKYIFIVLGTSLALVLLAFLFSQWVDPYGRNDISGWAKTKTQSGQQLLIAKRDRYLTQKPEIVILGNSRVDVGISPNSDATFNFGLPGASVGRLQSIYGFVTSHGTPKHIMIGLDFFDFCACVDNKIENDVLPATLLARLTELSRTRLSIESVTDSVATLTSQEDPYRNEVNDNGFHLRRSYLEDVESEGHFALFEQKLNTMKVDLQKADWILNASEVGANDPFSVLQNVVLDAQSKGIEITFFTYPYHQDLHQLVCDTGHYKEFLTWKTTVEEFVERQDSVASTSNISFRDFALINHLTSEPVPRRGDKATKMNWYWEAGHFKAALGSLMIGDLLSQPSTGATEHPDISDLSRGGMLDCP